ncbi:imidazoleglycerol-phosphate dehydratase [Gemmatimonas sp.]|jgi:imidazoleglycerol-phosphate dehydratase|uniref:imidazoleglycerol-phosphate dehydratase n=1 Tax=Gemmatimonas sp. TaxID=1962908 RepID=UPI0022BACC2F|nr:imidazoleglycerol-phosphate dehydratase [Gemmatimonas sp.]MCA2983357.1 imidazoleglycerol-phosphate dehydratase [Gemmatimonas sp.]MCA2987564.1 imidazoleglycerol-phosphate dehydratase [Gemmatimonas sp.]MCA2989945.1 imidazoleglycerol-phosphate dehydratase [Gemmatimonas sp.]MCA2996765.1 imidazoleglycerol-phosphate dehydratase [Gemmatimonas sp.]MCE2953391.1 imidazoleglycerol-phosphate dehydratase [Gemmatimonas sp.]
MTVVVRESKETRIRIALDEPMPAPPTISTTEPFLDHMLVALSKYAGVPFDIHATGDLRHHLIEDVAIALGQAFAAHTPATCARYGERTVPMDDALVQVVIDMGGRPYYRGPLPSGLYDHFMRSFADNAKATLHVRVLRGTDRHHIVEAAFKALGFALREALVETGAVFSTKGSVTLEINGQA